MAGDGAAHWDRLTVLAGETRAAEPGTGPGPAGLTLASTGGGGGSGGTEDLNHDAAPWTGAAGVADDLLTSVGKAKTKLGTSHEGVSSEGGGLASVTALDAVRHTWEQRLESARKECASLGPALRQVAKAHGEHEKTRASAFRGAGSQLGRQAGGARGDGR